MSERPHPPRLKAGFFERPVLEVAPELLGCTIEHAGVRIRLTEVEAYDGSNDPGSHAFRGETPRTRTMFGPPGGLYVYFTYGMHHCGNLVCGPAGVASAVLMRGGEVLEGVELARRRRGAPERRVTDRDLARGPARLMRALGLTRSDDGILTTDPGLPVVARGAAENVDDICSGPRVGVAGAGGDGDHYPWRFWIAGDRTVSTYRPAKPRHRARRG